MKKLSFSLSTALSLLLAGSLFAQTDDGEFLSGKWEYRQATGQSFDDEGEILQFTSDNGIIQGTYFGLEREGDHGLLYTATVISDLTLDKDGQVSFTVPDRDLYRTRPSAISDKSKMPSDGFIRNKLYMKGILKDKKLTINCKSVNSSCPDNVMVFQKGKWGQ